MNSLTFLLPDRGRLSTHLFQSVVSSDLGQRTFQKLPAGQSIQGLLGGSLRLRFEGRGERGWFGGRRQGEGFWRGGD